MRFGLPAAVRLLVLASCMLAGGCAMYGHALRDVDLSFAQGRPSEALARLDALGRSLRNEALYHAHRGMLLRATGDIEGSIAAFEAAKPLLEYQEATSVSETAGRLILAEGTTSYQPRPFERLQLHVLQTLNYLELGDWDAARVEATQIDIYLERVFDGTAPHGGDAFARYLSGIVYEGLGEQSNALIAYRKALQAYERSDMRVPDDLERRLLVYTQRLGADDEFTTLAERFGARRVAEARELDDELRNPERGEVIVVGATGLVPRRFEVTSLHQDLASGKFYRISLPSLRPRPSRAGSITVRESGETLSKSEPVENLAAAARKALDDELPGLIARAIARNVVKNRIANEAGEKDQGLEFLVNFAAAVLENADVRSWSTLPEKYHLLRAQLPVGVHDLNIVFEPGNRRVGVERVLNVTVIDRRPVVIGVNESTSSGEERQ